MITPEGGSGDVIDLQDMFSENEQVESATAELQLHGTIGSKDGEAWHNDGGTSQVFHNTVISPGTSAGDYEAKWDQLNGDTPDSESTPEGVWESLGTDNLELGWSVEDDAEKDATVRVSLRLGAGPSVLATADWSVSVVSTKT